MFLDISIIHHCSYDVFAGYVQVFLPQDGVTPLYVASQNGHSETVTILLRNGAGVNMADDVRNNYCTYCSPWQLQYL